VNGPNGLIDQHRVCKGCLEVKARCCVKLGRWREAREALESVVWGKGRVIRGNMVVIWVGLIFLRAGITLIAAPCLFSTYTTSTSSLSSVPALKCKAGIAALHGNLAHKAAQSFREALSGEPLMWEAWEGLCAVGVCP
jgi:anaphase-promoting complex subunit 3